LFPHQNPLYASLPLHRRHMPRPFNLFRFFLPSQYWVSCTDH
jgi:hypothetical protein